MSQEVEAKYTKANGYDDDAQVIYGDTDSVMVRFGCKDLETSMRLGKSVFYVAIGLTICLKTERWR